MGRAAGVQIKVEEGEEVEQGHTHGHMLLRHAFHRAQAQSTTVHNVTRPRVFVPSNEPLGHHLMLSKEQEASIKRSRCGGVNVKPAKMCDKEGHQIEIDILLTVCSAEEDTRKKP
jgi:Ser-tRNA(Ala) deacylase AlaX